jgi:peroxiredoxin
VLDDIRVLGATLVAVSPQTPDASGAFADDASLEFEVVSDVGSYVASDYGITFALPERDRELFLSVGNDLTQVNGSESSLLPVPTTYVIAEDGRIEYARIEPNYTVRPVSGEVLAALRDVVRRKETAPWRATLCRRRRAALPVSLPESELRDQAFAQCR